MGRIVIKGARQNNLKNISLEIPQGLLIAVTGVSGSGKSSLVFDTIYAEGQRRYIESLSTYARQFIEKLERPDVDEISGICPTIAIRQKNTVTSARSTIGTATEIYDYLRLLFARVGKTYCPECNILVKGYSPAMVSDEVLLNFSGKRVFILLPIEKLDAEGWKKRRQYYLSRGYSRVFCEGEVQQAEEFKCEDSCKVAFLVDRLRVTEENRTRMAEAVEMAFKEASNEAVIYVYEDKRFIKYNQSPVCPSCGKAFLEPTPLLFSFNSPYGACPDCKGFGDRMEFSEELIVPDKSKTLEERAIDPWSRERFEYFYYLLLDYCEENDIPIDVPYRELSESQKEKILEGDEDFIGVIPFLEKMREKSYKKGHRFFTRKYMDFTTCRTCKGGRLRKEAYNVRVGRYNIRDLSMMTPQEVLDAIDSVEFDERDRVVAKDILLELRSRLKFLIDVGLDYVTLNRLTRTLSGGEAQRINLANSLGANLVDALYVLDEPSVGLHVADNERLIRVLKRLRDSGNTVIVVEHDPEIILSGDYLIDLGPGAGENGGRILFSGTMREARKADVDDSKTLQWLFGKVKRGVQLNRKKRKAKGKIVLKGVHEHNLKSIDVSFPLGQFTCVTGVSGSGKSSLVIDVLYRVISKKHRSTLGAGLDFFMLEGSIDRVLLVDQSPIGTTPRSNPITYIKGFSFIREIFASQKEAMVRGYLPGRFSFNKPGGRCPKCQGMGFRRVEMHFMADVFVPCEQCEGKRYNRETLEILYRGKNISEVLDMTVDEALMFFSDFPQLGEKLWMLSRVGLGYLKLGQPSNTLSGGEAQRIKIARELAESRGQENLYIMDEPTTGLHMSDIQRLLDVIDELVDRGHTVIVIEHNMEVIKSADYIIDLGPGGGDNGGRVVARGAPEKIMRSKSSLTGRYLKKYISRYGG